MVRKSLKVLLKLQSCQQPKHFRCFCEFELYVKPRPYDLILHVFLPIILHNALSREKCITKTVTWQITILGNPNKINFLFVSRNIC